MLEIESPELNDICGDERTERAPQIWRMEKSEGRESEEQTESSLCVSSLKPSLRHYLTSFPRVLNAFFLLQMKTSWKALLRHILFSPS